MKKSNIAKTALYCGVAVAIIATTNAPRIKSATVNAETSLAGITITLDKYCATPAGEVSIEANEIPSVAANIATPSSVTAGAIAEDLVSEYANTGISTANEYVNIRKKASTESDVVGKLYRGAAATILENDGEWVKIKSGKCEGYINKEFLAIGFSAEELVEKYATKAATVNTTTLKVREKKSTESECITLIPLGETYDVIKEDDDWVKLSIDDGDVKGYVAKEFVDIEVEFKKAISIEEEQEQLRREEEARKAEEQRQKELQEEQERQRRAAQQSSSTRSTNRTNSNKSSSSTHKSNTKNKTTTTKRPSSSTNSVSTGNTTGDKIASYACQFVGNPYVYGGTSLTNGTDCSGFTQSVFKHFGITINRTSSQQSQQGTKISLSEAKAGDLVFYANGGSVGHVALYIGGGKVVHASNKRTGIIISSVNYRTVHSVRRILK